MKARSVSSRKLQLSPKNKRLLIIVAIAAVVLLVANTTGKLERYKQLAVYPNQACVGIAIAVKDGADIKHYNWEAKSRAELLPKGAVGQHSCTVGTVITSETHNADGSGSTSGYTLSSDVMYFKSSAAATAFGNVENKQRSWSVDEKGAEDGFHQDSLFTYIVTDVKEPYFEAYTVRGSTAFSLSLPCNMTNDLNASFDTCNRMAQKVLAEYASQVQSNLNANKLF